MYSSVPNKRPVRSYYFSKKSTLCALIRHYSIIMILPCAFINFCDIFHPVHLLSPVRLLGTPKYIVKFELFYTPFFVLHTTVILSLSKPSAAVIIHGDEVRFSGT